VYDYFAHGFEKNFQNCVNFIGGFLNVHFSAFALQSAQLRPKGYGFYRLLSALSMLILSPLLKNHIGFISFSV
ncbi:MAG: hypothetical protein V3T88_03475, partial [Nitrosomonadaceae bacterium]